MNAINHDYSASTALATMPAGWSVIAGGAESPAPAEPEATEEPAPMPAAIVQEFTIGRDAITKASTALARVVEKRAYVPILANVMLVASGGVLVITGTDCDIELIAIMECSPGEFAATVPAHLLADILKKAAPSDDAVFKLECDGEVASVRVGKAHYRLNCLPCADFPTMQPEAFSHRFLMAGEAWRDMLDNVKRAISKEETRYYLNGIFVHAVQNGNRHELRTTATDGHRMYIADADLPAGGENMPGVIVPRAAVELFLALTKGKACPNIVQVETNERHFRLSFGDMQLTTKLIDGSFPDYGRVTPCNNDIVARFNIAEAQAALDSVTVISSERGRAVKLTLANEEAGMSVTNPDSGTAYMPFACSLMKAGMPLECLEIGYNAGYLSALLADLADFGEEITAEFLDAHSPAIFRSGGNLLAVVMPMRV